MDLDEGEEQLEEQAVANDFESSSDEEDMDMLVNKAIVVLFYKNVIYVYYIVSL